MTTNMKEKISFDTNLNKYKYFKYEYFLILRAFLNYFSINILMFYVYYSYWYKFKDKTEKNIFFTIVSFMDLDLSEVEKNFPKIIPFAYTLLFIDLSLLISFLTSLYHSWKEEKNEEIEIYFPFFIKYIYLLLFLFSTYLSKEFYFILLISIFVLYAHYLWKKTKCDSEKKKVYYRLFLIVLLINIFIALNIICLIIELFVCNGIIKNFLIFIDDYTTLLYVLISLYLFIYLAIKDYEKQKKQMIMKKKRTLFKYFLLTFHIFVLTLFFSSL